MRDDASIREARDADGEGILAVVAACFAEYPGCVIDDELERPVFSAMQSYYAGRGGRAWVAVDGGDPAGAAVIGCVGCVAGASDHRGATLALQKLYVAPGARRRGLASRLCDLVEAEARARGAVAVELWSDTRFESAHRLYERRGYLRGPHTRDLHDASNSVEYYYRLALRS